MTKFLAALLLAFSAPSGAAPRPPVAHDHEATRAARAAARPSSARARTQEGSAGVMAAAAAAVNTARWRATVEELVAFRTRLTGSPGAAAARDYIAAQLSAVGLTVQTQQFRVNGADGYNVVGELTGTTRPEDIYIVCGHYDSISERSAELAPGAEDNGSGAAGVVELARVLAAAAPAATVRFVAFAGEEQGLYGSTDYVERLKAKGETGHVRGVINMDMIAFSKDDDLDVLLEAGSNAEALVNTLAASAAAVTRLRVVTSFNPFGSDHVPFIRNGIPAVLTIENDWDDYPGYHKSSDTMAYVRDDMGTEVLKMNAAALALLAGVGPERAAITSVRFTRKGAAARLVVYGRFAWQTSRIEVDGRRLESTIFKEKDREGDVARRIYGADPALASLVPKRTPVRVRVVDTATGETTDEFVYTR